MVLVLSNIVEDEIKLYLDNKHHIKASNTL